MKEGGELTISTSSLADQVLIKIKDSGVGIPPDVLKRIFEPFYTTKEIGKGTGLGLSISYGIIQNHNGRIAVQSELGKGSEFTVYLPVKQDFGCGLTPSSPPMAATNSILPRILCVLSLAPPLCLFFGKV